MNNVKEFKLWETKVGEENYIYFTNVDDFFKYIEEHNGLTSYTIKDNYNVENEAEDFLDDLALKNNINLVYTDKDHPIALNHSGLFGNYISSSFFEANKEKFKEYELKKLQKSTSEKRPFIRFPSFIFSDEVLKMIVDANIGNSSIVCHEVDSDFKITDEQRKFLQENHIDFKITYRFKDSEQVSTKEIIGDYTFEELKTSKHILITLPIEQKDIDNFIYINENAVIELEGYEREKYSLEPNRNEVEYFKNIIEIMKSLESHNRKYNIKIDVKNRQLLEQSNLLNSIPNNINVTINFDRYDYDIETYQKEEEKLEKLVAGIKNSNLSPFEKYLACYNIAKKFKPYKENPNKKEQARKLKYILEDDNDYIVCLGFANLLSALLHKVGIQNQVIGVSVDTSYDKGFTVEDKSLEMAGHARNLIKIDDDKYGIHGYYLADSTFDNSMINDLYTNALLTFEQKKGSKRLERLDDTDLILDFNSKDDFNKKINYYIKKEIYDQRKYGNGEKEEFIVYAYRDLYDKIMNMLYHTNPEKYNYFYKKYDEVFKQRIIKLNILEPIAYQFLDEYADYILPLTNKKVSFDTLLEAAIVVKKEVDKKTDDEIKDWLEEAKEKNRRQQEKSFPYDYKINDNIQGIIEDTEDVKQK